MHWGRDKAFKMAGDAQENRLLSPAGSWALQFGMKEAAASMDALYRSQEVWEAPVPVLAPVERFGEGTG